MLEVLQPSVESALHSQKSWEEAAEDKGGIWGGWWEACQLACSPQNTALVRDPERADIPEPDMGDHRES